MHTPTARRLTKYLTAMLLLPHPLTALGETSTWEIDPEHFSISFEAEHIGFQKQLGLFLEGAGSFRYDPETGELDSGHVEVQSQSIFSNHDARDAHLRSDEFLDVDNHPVVSFEATSFAVDTKNNSRGVLSGDLTMLGNTHPVELAIVINKRARYPFGHRQETLGVSASTTINRSRWGMDYAVANNLVGDTVSLRFEFEAIRQ